MSEHVLELLQVESEFEPVLEIYRDLKPKRVLEIGCWDGLSLKAWLTEADPELVVAVDLEHRNRGDYDAWVKPGTELVLYTGMSQAQEQAEAMQKHAPYDWVFVDGDHGDWGVRTDVETCEPLVKPGGYLILHDITPPAGTESYPPGVVLAEFEARGRHVQRFEDPKPETWSHGIGVVHL